MNWSTKHGTGLPNGKGWPVSDKIRITCEDHSYLGRIYINDQEVPPHIIRSIAFDMQPSTELPVVHLELMGPEFELNIEANIAPIIRPVPGFKIVQYMVADRLILRSVPDAPEENNGQDVAAPIV